MRYLHIVWVLCVTASCAVHSNVPADEALDVGPSSGGGEGGNGGVSGSGAASGGGTPSGGNDASGGTNPGGSVTDAEATGGMPTGGDGTGGVPMISDVGQALDPDMHSQVHEMGVPDIGTGGAPSPPVRVLSSTDPNFSNNGAVVAERYGTALSVESGELTLGDWNTVRAGSLDLGSRESLDFQYAPLGPGAGYIRANWDPVPDAEAYNVSIVDLQSGRALVEEQRVPAQPTTIERRGLTLRGAWENSTLAGGLGGPQYEVRIRPVTSWADENDEWATALRSNTLQIAEAEFWDGATPTRDPADPGYTPRFPGNLDAFYGAHVFERVAIDQLTYVHVQPFGRSEGVESGVDSLVRTVSEPRDGWLAVYANVIDVGGRLDAAGRGLGGGGGSGLSPGNDPGNLPGQGGSLGLSGNGGGNTGGRGVGAGGGGCSRNQRGQSGGTGGPMGGGGGGCTLDNCGDWGVANGPAGVGGTCSADPPYWCSGGVGGESQACDANRGGFGGNGADCVVGGDCPEAGGRNGTQGPGGGGGGYGAGGGAAGSGAEGVQNGYAGGGGGGGGTGGGAGSTAGRLDSGGRGAGRCGGRGGRGDRLDVPFGGAAGAYSCGGFVAGDGVDRLGSGGGGGGAPDCAAPAGGGGGAGGGSIRLSAAHSLAIRGTAVLRADGAAGGGGAGNAFGSANGGCSRFTGGGGGGGGGGIEIRARNLSVEQGAVLRALGGEDGHGDAARAPEGGSVVRTDTGGVLFASYGDGSDVAGLPAPNTAFSDIIESPIEPETTTGAGYYTSSVVRFRRTSRVTGVQWDEPRGRPAGSIVKVWFRVAGADTNGDPSSDEWAEWSGPFQVAAGTEISASQSGSYIQYRVKLVRGANGATPVVGSIRFSYVEE